MSRSRISLNGMKVEILQTNSDIPACSFKAYVKDMPDNQIFRSLRESLEDEWFLYWRQGKVYGIPKVTHPQKSFGQLEELTCSTHLQFLTARINDLLPGIFSKYSPLKRRPFTFLAQREEKELISIIAKKIKDLPSIITSFKIIPKYILEPKIFELHEDKFGIGLFLCLKTRWQILATLSELQNEGVELQGLYVVRRHHIPGQRRLVGRIEYLSKQEVTLSESFDCIDSIHEKEVCLEGSRESFSRCLKAILGKQYKAFDSERDNQEGQLLIGPAFDTTLEEMQKFLKRKSPLEISSHLQGKIGDRILATNTEDYQTTVIAPQVEYCFDAARTKKSIYAWPGINQYGPFSRETFSKKTPEILVIFPDTAQGAIENFLRQLKDGISIKKKKVDEGGNIFWEETSCYLGGFAKIFGLINPKFTLQAIPWFKKSHKPPANLYRSTIEKALKDREMMPTAAIVLILDGHTLLADLHSPYLHSKALLLMAGIPVQEIRLTTANQAKENLQYTLQNFTVALYAKMNGSLWTFDNDLTIHDELVIGIGICELSGSRFTERQRFVGITTVFQGDGNYLLSNLSKECRYEEYPDVLKDVTLSILQDIKQRNNWQPGDTVRLVFHASKPLKNIEVADIISECVAQVGSEQNIEFAFLTISRDHPFMMLDKSQSGIPVKRKAQLRKGVYAPDRGTILQLGRYTRLLSITSPRLIKRANSPLPKPLLINLHRKSNYYDLTSLTEQVLKFTSLSWKSLLPVSEPVTIYYSELIAKLLARLKNVRGWSPEMLNIKLRASKWFL